MNPERLLSEELTYELVIRGIISFGTVAEKRKLLRDALKTEIVGIEIGLPAGTDQIIEVAICENIIKDLNNEMSKFDINNAENDYARIHTRLLHVKRRINRITEPNLLNHRNNSDIVIKYLERNLKQLYDKTLNTTSSTANETQNIEQLIDISTEQLENTLAEQHTAHVAKQHSLSESTRLEDMYTNLTERPSIPNFENTTENRLNIDCSNRQPTISFNLPGTSTSYVPNYQQDINSRVFDKSAQRTYDTFNISPLDAHRAHCSRDYTTNQNESYKHQQPIFNFSQPSTSRSNNQNYNRTFEKPLSSWNITFNGSNLSVNQFIERVNELSVSRNVTEERLFYGASELFSGDALIWFRSIRHEIFNWSELMARLRKDFLPADFTNDLWDEIRSRKQGYNEKVIIFIAVLENLFHRLPFLPPENVRLEQIIRNLQPYFQSQLTLRHVPSILALREMCKALEDTKLHIDRFKNTSSNQTRNILEPDLSTRVTQPRRINEIETNNITNPFVNNNISAVNTTSDTPNNNNSVTRFLCWNCKQTSHQWRNCNQPLNRFCYGCGMPNVTIKNCTKCSKNLNTERATAEDTFLLM